jgi:polar amino acid transport system permease protein
VTRRRRKELLQWAVFIAGIAAVVLFLVLTVRWDALGRRFFNPAEFTAQFPRIITEGIRNTLLYTAIGFGGGMVLGLLAALMRRSEVAPARALALVYVDTMRSLPALLVIVLVGYGLPIAFGDLLPSWANSNFGAGGVALAVVAGAYLAETIRAGIEAVPTGQVEAARSLGLSTGQTTRFVVLPQALRVVIPPLTNEFILLLKDSSLISTLGIIVGQRELTTIGKVAANTSGNYTGYMAAATCYLMITLPLTFMVRRLERRGKR